MGPVNLHVKLKLSRAFDNFNPCALTTAKDDTAIIPSSHLKAIMSQNHDLHRALLRPAIIHTLRAAGFHSTKPSVLDTLINLAERHISLLASTTAQHAWLSHNDPVPTLTDVRMALSDCGVLIPMMNPAEEGWKERMRRPLTEMENVAKGGQQRVESAKRKRDEEDTKDVRDFTNWYDSTQYREIRRVAGLIPDPNIIGVAPAVGVGGNVVQGDDFFTILKKKHNKGGDDSRLQGTVLGRVADEKEVIVEGGPVQHIRDWKPKLEERSANIQAQALAAKDTIVRSVEVPPDERPDTAMREITASG